VEKADSPGKVDAPARARPAAPTDQAERVDVMQRAAAGDRAALPQMLAMFDEAASRFVEAFGNMATHVENSLISGAGGKDLTVKEGLSRKLAGIRKDLAGPDPTPIERLLAERAALCWLTVYEYERRYADAGSIPIVQADYHQRRIDGAHRRFLS